MLFNSLYFILSDTGKPPKFEARKMHNKSKESEMPLVIPDREYEIESLPLYQEDMVTKSISSEDNLSEDFAASRQTKIKSMPSDDNFGDDFVYTRKAKGKKSVPGKSLVRVYTYQVNEEMQNMESWFYFCFSPQFSYLTHKLPCILFMIYSSITESTDFPVLI